MSGLQAHPPVQFTFSAVADDHMRRTGAAPEDMLGDIPAWLSSADDRGAVEQIDAFYGFGGGWRDFQGFRLTSDAKELTYPGDPPMRLIAEAVLRDERILVFECSWVVVLQADGSFRAARID